MERPRACPVRQDRELAPRGALKRLSSISWEMGRGKGPRCGWLSEAVGASSTVGRGTGELD